MKWPLVLLATLGCAAFVYAGEEVQPFPRDAGGDARFQEVVQVEGATAAQLYGRAKLWAAKAFSSAKDVVQLDDSSGGRLVLKGSDEETFGLGDHVWFHFTLTVEVKDGRYRWTIDQLQYCGPKSSNCEPIERELTQSGIGVFGRKAVFERFRKSMLKVATDLEPAMKKPAGSGDKW